MSTEVDALFQRAFKELRQRSFLLKADAELPSVSTMAAGKPIRGSWWGHPKGSIIFAVLERLADHPDVIMAKLVSGKDTFIHREAWPGLLAVVLAGDSRDAGLSPLAQSILKKLRKRGEILAASIPIPRGAKTKVRGDAIRELEGRLLIYSEEFHTEKGAHSKRLESWGHWAKRRGLRRPSMAPEEAKVFFSKCLKEAGGNRRARLPFQVKG